MALATRDGVASMCEAEHTTGPTVNFLPELDPHVMGYRDRHWYLDPQHRDLVFDRGGNATSVVLVDGRIAGVWDLVDRPEPAVRFLVFDTGRAHLGEIETQADQIGRFWFDEPPRLVECASMTPLTERSGVMRRPLDGAVHASRR